MSFVTIMVTEENEICTIKLNRPERRNAMTPEMQEELCAAMDQAAASDCRVVVLAGEGEAFCAGLDLSALQGMNDKSGEKHEADALRIARLFRTLYELQKPTIAAVHGPAIAGGTGLATICDFTLATPQAKFAYTEVRIGFVPALVSAFLTLQLGDKLSRDLLLTGRVFTSEEALRLGLVNEIVQPEHLAARTRQLAAALIANSPESIAVTKRLLADQNRAWLDAAIARALVANAAARTKHDFREGVASFLEKRKPVWKQV